MTLVAVTSSDRGQTLEAMDIEHTSFSNQGVIFPIYSLLKTTRHNKPVKIVKCHKFSNPALDVCEYVSSYLTRTLKFRLKAVQKGGSKPRQLFLSWHMGKPVKRATLSKYVVRTMELAGIDVSSFKAHSTRGLFPSIMKRKGFSAQQILSQGDWSNVNTFQRFYGREPDDSPAGILISEMLGKSRK